MKTISSALRQGIDNGTLATCVKITRTDGIVKGFTNHDVQLTVDTVTYEPTPGLHRVVMNLRNNAEVSNQEFTGAWIVDLNEDDLTNGVYDDAEIEVIKVDWTNPSAGGLVVFAGTLGLVQWMEDGFRADIQSSMKLLARTIGVEVSGKCRHDLFDTASSTRVGFCGVDKPSHTYASSVSAISTQKLIFDIGTIGQADGWIANGVLTWTSGNNNGSSYEVKDFTTDTITLFLPTTYTIQVGDTFTVTAGCDKTIATCKSKFSNSANFGGFPHIKNEINFK